MLKISFIKKNDNNKTVLIASITILLTSRLRANVEVVIYVPETTLIDTKLDFFHENTAHVLKASGLHLTPLVS